MDNCGCLERAVNHAAARDELVIPVFVGQRIPLGLEEISIRMLCTVCARAYHVIPYSTFDKRVTA